jgi:F0F1-type ATP synthase assembly protein I
MTEQSLAAPNRAEGRNGEPDRRFAGRLLAAVLVGAALGAVLGHAVGIAPFAALVGAPIGMAGAVLVGR